MFLVGLLLPLIWHYAHADAICRSNGQLSVYMQPVEQKGIKFDKLLVNRSVPAQVSYEVRSNSPKVDYVTWAHNGQTIKVEEGTGDGHEVWYKLERRGSAFLVELHIPLPTARVTGNWTLTVYTEDKEEHVAVCFIEAPPIIRTRLGAVRANEGESLAVECELESYPLPSEVMWKRVLVSDEGSQLVPVVNATFTAKDGVQNAVMEWSDATHVSGPYLCTAKSPRGSDTQLFDVRIKGKSAFIWPAVGIALELLVLLITIVVYERHQAKRRKAEENCSLVKAEK
ncbi:Basigin [Clonorchis sinensis]|uniref:Basigin n=2 Tax=Clonorchis sinensis TaxID=79923 RepID=A0A8T1LYC9_CLOSI|nr:Basigin [Clonorchis sinensis]